MTDPHFNTLSATGPPPLIIGLRIFGVKIQSLTSGTPRACSFRERLEELLEFPFRELAKIFLKADRIASLLFEQIVVQ